jgi:signal transduction histidine kinase
VLCVEDLLSLELFRFLPPARLDWICERAQPCSLNIGEVLLREGDPPRGFLVLISGRMAITRRSGGVEMPIGQHEAPSFLGEIPILTDEPALVTIRAITACRLYEISGEDFRKVLHECRDFERQMFRAIYQRIRGLEAFIQNREKLAALGTLAAGLAHELNNPAAALVRALRNVPDALLELQRMNLVYGQRQVDEAHTQHWLQVRDRGYDLILNHLPNSTANREREERLLEWLEAYQVNQAWKLAEPLALGGVEVETLDQLMKRWRNDPTELREMGLHWLALSFDVIEMIASGKRSAERISDLVEAMKSYSYLDQGAQQLIDIHEGIENTLLLFAAKLKQGIQIQRHYHSDLPRLLAYGSELNQVWTSLLDNAIDAMGETGILEITTGYYKEFVQVHITDSGHGIPVELQTRIFEPFFTTKAVGQGSGLGLDLVRRIVENRHHGSVTCASQPGKTTFTVCLPLTPPHTLPTLTNHEDTDDSPLEDAIDPRIEP